MKRLYVLFIGLLLCTGEGLAQCESQWISLFSQADIDNYPQNYGCMNPGRLAITGTDVTNLNGLAGVITTGYFYIHGVPNLHDYSGLANLTTVTGDFDIGHGLAANVTAFSGVTSISGTLTIASNTLTTLDAFDNLTSIGGGFQVLYSAMSAVPGMPSLTSIGTDINIEGNDLLVSLSNFGHQLQTLGRHVISLDNDALTALPQISNVTHIPGALRIQGNSNLQSLSGLDNVTAVGDYLNIVDNASLQGIGALHNLQSIGSSLIITGNPLVSVCNQPFVCSFVNNPTGALNISNNAPGCNNTTQTLVSCGSPQNCNAQVIQLLGQQDVDDFPLNYGCSAITGSLQVRNYYNDTTNVNGLSALTSVSGSVEIAGSTIVDMHGFDNMTHIGDTLYLYPGPDMDAGNLFPSLEYTGGIYIAYDLQTPSVGSIRGFNNLTEIGHSFLIGAMTSLQTVDGFHNLERISYPASNYQGLVIEQNPLLTTVNAFENLSVIGEGIRFNLNDSLTYLPNFSSLHTIDEKLDITNNPSLINLTGLGQLASVDGSVNINNNAALTSLSGLGSLQSTTYLTISNNPQLTNIAGLSALAQVGGSPLIYNNPQLSVCNNPGICSVLTLANAAIYDNAPGCDSATQVLVACGYPQNCGDIYLYTQHDIDTFYLNHGCSTVTSSLHIVGGGADGDITNLNGLSGITSIRDLVVENAPYLTSLAGMSGLTNISGNFLISGDFGSSISGLPALADINGDFRVYTTNLVSIGNFPSLTHVGGDFVIGGNPNLTSVTGFGNLATIDGQYSVHYNESLAAFPNLPNLVSIGNNLYIFNNAALLTFSGLDNVTSIGGRIEIISNPALTSLSGLDRLVGVGGEIHIRENTSLLTLAGISGINPQSITYLDLQNNALLATCNVPSICSYLSLNLPAVIYGNARTCENNTQVLVGCGFAQNCNYVYLDSQTDVDDFPINYGCTAVNSLFLVGNGIANVDGLGAITSIGALSMNDTSNLADYSGFNHVTQITGSVSISNCASNLSGFPAVTGIGGNLSISMNPALTTITAFQNVTAVNGSLTIFGNPALTSLSGFRSLHSINGSLDVSANSVLTSLDGLEHIDPSGIAQLSIYNSPQLSYCNVASICSFLSSGGYANIGGNATGCNEMMEISQLCFVPALSLTLFLQGTYEGARMMRPAKFNRLVENAGLDEVQDLTVTLYDSITLAPAATLLATLHTDGAITAALPPLDGQYYIAVEGAGLVGTWSAEPQNFSPLQAVSYDFSSSASQAYGDNLLEVEPGIWAIYSGDINADENIDNFDFGLWEIDAREFAYGDYVTDLNGDGNVDNFDFAIWETNAGNFIYSVHPMH